MYTMKLMGIKQQFHHGDFMGIQRNMVIYVWILGVDI